MSNICFDFLTVIQPSAHSTAAAEASLYQECTPSRLTFAQKVKLASQDTQTSSCISDQDTFAMISVAENTTIEIEQFRLFSAIFAPPQCSLRGPVCDIRRRFVVTRTSTGVQSHNNKCSLCSVMFERIGKDTCSSHDREDTTCSSRERGWGLGFMVKRRCPFPTCEQSTDCTSCQRG
jgi:hypothetical protein